MPKVIQYQELAFVDFVPPAPPSESVSMDVLQLLPRKYFQYDPSPFLFKPPPEQDAFVNLSWGPKYPDYFPALKLSSTALGQFAYVRLPPPVITPLVPLSWSPHAAVFFSAPRMIQEAYGQFVPHVMNAGPNPPSGSGNNNFLVTFIPTNSIVTG